MGGQTSRACGRVCSCAKWKASTLQTAGRGSVQTVGKPKGEKEEEENLIKVR